MRTFLGFVIGCAIGWGIWFFAVRPALEPDDGSPRSDWLYYGSLVLCLAGVLFVVSVVAELLNNRRMRRADGDANPV